MGYNHNNNCIGKLKIINVSSRLERLMSIKLSLAYWTMIFFNSVLFLLKVYPIEVWRPVECLQLRPV
jgi:hypothetical protein